jgi:hypothetical protein
MKRAVKKVVKMRRNRTAASLATARRERTRRVSTRMTQMRMRMISTVAASRRKMSSARKVSPGMRWRDKPRKRTEELPLDVSARKSPFPLTSVVVPLLGAADAENEYRLC